MERIKRGTEEGRIKRSNEQTRIPKIFNKTARNEGSSRGRHLHICMWEVTLRSY
jgi:hypothetical protein